MTVTRKNSTHVTMTQADLDGGAGIPLSGDHIVIVDANDVPTGVTAESGASGAVPIPTAGAGAATSSAGTVTQVSASNTRVQFTQSMLDAGGPVVHLNDGVTGLDLVAADWTDARFFHLTNVSASTTIPLTAGAGWTRARTPTLSITSGDLLSLQPGEYALVQMSNGYLNVAEIAGSGGRMHQTWDSNTWFEKGELVYANATQGAIGIGDPIIRNTSGKSGATFDATEAAKWTEAAQDPDLMTLGTAQTVIAVKTFSTLPEMGADATTANQPVRLGQHNASLALKFATALVAVAMDAAAGYPTASVARSFVSAGNVLNISGISATSFSGVDLNGTSIADGVAGQFIAGSLNTTVANEVSCWFGVVDGGYTKCVRAKFVNSGSNVDVTVTETGHWNGDVLVDAGWTTAGGVPASRQSTGAPASSNGAAGYGLEALTITFAAVASPALPGLMGTTDRVKLAGIAAGATANDTDANLKNRANHTGSQATSTITGLDTALTARELTSNRNAASGYAGLDASGKVAAAQLPSYVDDVIEAANLAALPGTGTAGIIYVALDTNKPYRWSGSAYVEISPSPGSTDAVTEGALNLYFTAARAKAAAVADALADGVMDVAPSQNAVFDALNARQATSEKGTANGYASLGGDGRVPTAQLPVSASKLTYSDTDVSGNATVDATAAVTQPTVSQASGTVTTSAFASTIGETHASTKWERNGVMGAADAVALLSKLFYSTTLGVAVPIRAAHVDSNGNQSQRSAAVNVTTASASITMPSGYPTDTVSKTFDHSDITLALANLKTDSFTTVTMGGQNIGASGNGTNAAAYIANTLNVGVANEVSCWFGFYDGTYTKAVKAKFTVSAGNIVINITRSSFWTGNVLASASWTTSGAVPAGESVSTIASAINSGAYGLAALTINFQA